MGLIDDFAEVIGAENVATGAAADRWASDWTGKYGGRPGAVLRPATTEQVAALLRRANTAGHSITPVSGNTGLVGGAQAAGGLMLSLDRMNAIRAINPAARTAIVEAGVILSSLHDAADAHDLSFPMSFGARGSAMIGGILSTNAGGSNVLRHGNARALCLGIEAVLADGRVLNLMSELHKDNSGLDLRDLLIGAEGQLGVITAAVLKLAPKPRAHATAMIAVPRLGDALALLNRLQDATGGAVEAFELMPRNYIQTHLDRIDGARPPFDAMHDVNILVEIATTAPRDATPAEDGTLPVVALLQDELERMLEADQLRDAVIARSEAQRSEMWARREAAAELTFWRRRLVDTDVALPLDRVAEFIDRANARMAELDPESDPFYVAHLGDGNVHYTVYVGSDDIQHRDRVTEAIEDIVADLGGSFSAEHGIGQSKLATLRRRKDPVALDVMRQIKAALDPKGILNPGKTLP